MSDDGAVTMGGRTFKVTCEPAVDRDTALGSAQFTTWVNALDKKYDLEAVHMQSVDMFGPRVGFLKFKADVKMDGIALPGICFARGGAVAVLPVLRCTTPTGIESHVLLTKQPRIPVGRDIVEIPAGMLDGDGNFKGVAAKEMEEETGLVLTTSDLVDLTAREPAHHPGIIPSAGGCDEFVRLFLYVKDVTPKELEALEGKITGCRAEGERITLMVAKYDEVWRLTNDVKALCAMFLAERFGLVAPPTPRPGGGAGAGAS